MAFLVNDEWHLVDLPGYGYAKTGKQKRESFTGLIYDYCTRRANLDCLFVLLDSRLPLQAIDREFLTWCSERGTPMSLIFTKADKNSKAKLARNIEAIENELLKTWEELPNVFVSSAHDKRGRDDILEFIGYVMKELKGKKQES